METIISRLIQNENNIVAVLYKIVENELRLNQLQQYNPAFTWMHE